MTTVAVGDEAAVEVLAEIEIAVKVFVDAAVEENVASGASVARVLCAPNSDNEVPAGQHPPSVPM